MEAILRNRVTLCASLGFNQSHPPAVLCVPTYTSVRARLERLFRSERSEQGMRVVPYRLPPVHFLVPQAGAQRQRSDKKN